MSLTIRGYVAVTSKYSKYTALPSSERALSNSQFIAYVTVTFKLLWSMRRMGTPPKLPEIRTENNNAVLKNKLYLLFYLKTCILITYNVF